MEDVVSRAFVLRTRPYGESDLIAVLLTEAYGKVSGIARGARRSRRRFAGPALEPFQEIEVRLARRPHAGLAFLHEARVLTSHHHIAEDVLRFAWGAYACELAERMVPERDPCPDVFGLLESTLAALAAGAPADAQVHHFVLGLLDRAGWGPDFTRCGVCGNSICGADCPILDARGSGVICARHEAERTGRDPEDPEFRPSRRVIHDALLAYVREARSRVVDDAAVELRDEASLLLDRLVDLHLGAALKSRRFLAEVRAQPPAQPV